MFTYIPYINHTIYHSKQLIIIPAKAREYVFIGVGLSVCLSVTTITKKCEWICTKFYAKIPRGNVTIGRGMWK